MLGDVLGFIVGSGVDVISNGIAEKLVSTTATKGERMLAKVGTIGLSTALGGMFDDYITERLEAMQAASDKKNNIEVIGEIEL